MSSRHAQAAAQADPDRNFQFRRWPAPAMGPDYAPIRCWHAPDEPVARVPAARLAAERAWARVVAARGARHVSP